MTRKRIAIWLGITLIGMGILIARLAQLQLIETKSFSKHDINLLEESAARRMQEIVIDNGRGNFMDRSGKPLSYETVPVLILFPFLEKTDWPAEKVAEAIGISESELRHTIGKSDKPVVLGGKDPYVLTEKQMEKVNKLEIPGVISMKRKYTPSPLYAGQLLGLTSSNAQVLKEKYKEKEFPAGTLVGISGLQKSFDEFLLGEGKSRLVYHVDGRGGPLFGIDVKYSEPANPFYPVNIVTTIDSRFQRLAEQQADKHGINKGGVVLLDIETNNILAMVSRPKVNRQSPFADQGSQNMMLKQQIPGSVFKTVVAAAALDKGQLEGRLFDCSKKINGSPDKKYDHGTLDFNKSFARSCNRTFADLAKELQKEDPRTLEEYAKKLSLTGTVGWEGGLFHTENFRQLPDEDKGRVFLSEQAKEDPNYAGLSGIGQHEVRVTPVSVANMMAVIARGGDKQMVRAVTSIQYKNGSKMAGFQSKKLDGGTISPLTAEKLQFLLRQVVTDELGTGQWFKDLPMTVAGKSGTAETGVYKGKKQLHNKWFAGYFPYENPRYALVAVNLGVSEDEGGVNLLFSDLVKGIGKIEKKE
ncbi:peptidoglycan D,D-transpeptidase FtsI family protein [Mesobacillus zeae]|uniref:serine-type D-Ala-D-Ala carboxypeptidase n=1 Tax=Mesobacillus zeae TaxID=1917180 RepID=A0A398B1F2_9BACI|nr:penicillin-binding transpeptidase domain-containing protein [Mesobacillus zeae]RID83759.1 penicillin-binding protein 2 [Mesobacillus zeae]